MPNRVVATRYIEKEKEKDCILKGIKKQSYEQHNRI